MEKKIEPCDICGTKYTEEMCKLGEKLSEENMPCFCNDIKRVLRLRKKIKSQKEEIKSQKEEISNLNGLLSDAGESEWDSEGMYEDARDGKFNGNDIGGVPDEDFAKWIAERNNLKIDKEGDIIK